MKIPNRKMISRLNFLNQRWFQIFIVGTALFFGAEQTLKITGNLNFVPAVIVLGAVLPAAFVGFYYQERKIVSASHSKSPFEVVTICFVVGGLIGITAAGLLEYETLHSSSVLTIFGIGAIEEFSKLIFPFVLFFVSRFRSEADGLLFGIASGMGFAALETMGYGLVALVNSHGNVGVAEETLLIRGLLSPVGHAAWTGFVCATIWNKREKTGKLFGWIIIPAFAIAVTLHGLWDVASSASNLTVVYLGYAGLGLTSFSLLVFRLLQANMKPDLVHDTVTIPPDSN